MNEPINIEAEEALSQSRGTVPFPPGYNLNSTCPQCHSDRLIACLVNPEADERDPDILCLNCGHRW